MIYDSDYFEREGYDGAAEFVDYLQETYGLAFGPHSRDVVASAITAGHGAHWDENEALSALQGLAGLRQTLELAIATQVYFCPRRLRRVVVRDR